MNHATPHVMACAKLSTRAIAFDVRASTTNAPEVDGIACDIVWTQGTIARDDGTTCWVEDDGVEVRARRKTGAVDVARHGAYTCVRGRLVRESGRWTIVDAVVVGCEDEGRRRTWRDETEESRAARRAFLGASAMA